MDSFNTQEQLARLKKSNERLTILCLIFGAIAIAAGLYARIQKSIANENIQMAALASKRAAEEKQKAQLSAQEAIQQRKMAEATALELFKLRGKTKPAK